MAKFLKLPSDRLSKLAELQRREELKRDLACPPAPMFGEIRELIVRKCVPGKTNQVRAIFEKQPFGELERLVTQKLLDVTKKVAKEESNSENWLHLVLRCASKVGAFHPLYMRYCRRDPRAPSRILGSSLAL